MLIKKKMYFYVVSFKGISERGQGDFCVQIFRPKKVRTFEDFEDLREFIRKENHCLKVIINNIMLMGKVKV